MSCQKMCLCLASSLQLLPWKKPSFPFDALTKENWMVIRDFDVFVNPPTLSEFEELAKSLANANNVPTTIWNKANRLNCILMFQNVLARLLQAKPNLLDSTTDLNLIIFKSGLFKLPTETITSSSEAAGLGLHNSEGTKKPWIVNGISCPSLEAALTSINNLC